MGAADAACCRYVHLQLHLHLHLHLLCLGQDSHAQRARACCLSSCTAARRQRSIVRLDPSLEWTRHRGPTPSWRPTTCTCGVMCNFRRCYVEESLSLVPHPQLYPILFLRLALPHHQVCGCRTLPAWHLLSRRCVGGVSARPIWGGRRRDSGHVLGAVRGGLLLPIGVRVTDARPMRVQRRPLLPRGK